MANGRFFIARHGETVFNAAGRMQGDHAHTPLTRAGFAQAEEMGAALAGLLGPTPPLTLWASDTGRALQTLAVIAEHLGLDWHRAHTDRRLGEIAVGEWSGRDYRELAAEGGTLIDAAGLFTRPAPGGEWYDDIAVRMRGWLDELGDAREDRLVITHGMSSRVLRGLLTDAEHSTPHRAPVMPGLPQGSVVMIEDGVETVVHRGRGHAPA